MGCQAARKLVVQTPLFSCAVRLGQPRELAPCPLQPQGEDHCSARSLGCSPNSNIPFHRNGGRRTLFPCRSFPLLQSRIFLARPLRKKLSTDCANYSRWPLQLPRSLAGIPRLHQQAPALVEAPSVQSGRPPRQFHTDSLNSAKPPTAVTTPATLQALRSTFCTSRHAKRAACRLR